MTASQATSRCGGAALATPMRPRNWLDGPTSSPWGNSTATAPSSSSTMRPRLSTMKRSVPPSKTRPCASRSMGSSSARSQWAGPSTSGAPPSAQCGGGGGEQAKPESASRRLTKERIAGRSLAPLLARAQDLQAIHRHLAQPGFAAFLLFSAGLGVNENDADALILLGQHAGHAAGVSLGTHELDGGASGYFHGAGRLIAHLETILGDRGTR